MNHKIDRDTYIIPPNFIESGTFFGGMFKARNVIEAGILAFAIGVPVFSLLPLGLTARIIALCLTALPAALVALIGISGESLSSFLLIFLKYLRNRRIVGGNSAEDAVPAAEHGGKHIKKKAHKPDKTPRRSRRSGREDFPAEFDEVRSYEIRQKLRPVKKQKSAKEKKAATQKKKVSKERKVKRPIRTQEPKPACLNPVADYLPISKIENGIIYTKDHRYVKVVEVVPINFMLRSAQEQRNIIYSFVSYLKISPIKLQIKVLTRRAEINRHLDTVRKEMEQETNEQCLLMQEDYLQFVQQIGSREAITRRFFLIFEYEPWSNTKRSDEEGEAINALQSAVHTATNYLRQCGNEVIVPENWDGLCQTLDHMMDSTDWPQVDYEAETLLSRISHRLERLYNVMQKTRHTAEGEKEELQSLVSDISHQTKTPIANLKLINDTMLTRPLTEEKRKEFLQATGTQLDKLDFLIQGMVKTSRLETGVITLEKQDAVIGDTLVSAINGVLAPMEQKEISLSVDCPSDLTISHDSRWTSEALFNILDNAVKYTSAGGSIQVRVRDWEMYLRIDVTDTGRGIPEHSQGTIFKRFYRDEAVHDIDGVGIGLYLAREIITMQGGYITVESKVGEGSTFSVFLPIK